jgi:hypothetical protein
MVVVSVAESGMLLLQQQDYMLLLQQQDYTLLLQTDSEPLQQLLLLLPLVEGLQASVHTQH